MPNYKTVGGGYDAPSSNSSLAMTGLVYKVTHTEDQYLSYMKRSFISFSYGGKNIEDFNLIATISNNSLSRNGYAAFEDITSSYETLDGQLFWGSHYTTNSLDLTLSTDGITQMDLDEFLRWFSPGKSKELILAEHPNRAIMARISDTPKIELLPFELKIKVRIGGEDYDTSTTMYKGDISISFVMDDPFWYAKINIFGYMDDNEVYHDTWTDANGNTVSVYDNPDAIKIAAEDGIPFSSMLTSSLLLGNNIFARLESDENGIVALESAEITLTKDNNTIILTAVAPNAEGIIETKTVSFYSTGTNNLSNELKWRAIAMTTGTSYAITSSDNSIAIYEKLSGYLNNLGTNTITLSNVLDINPRSLIATVTDEGRYIRGARIAGPHISATTGIEQLTNEQRGYFYYAGTAPSFPILEFVLTPKFENYFISIPKNTYVDNEHPYNVITIKSTSELVFMFTTPNIYTSYNLTIEIFNNLVQNGEGWETIRLKIRTNVNHYRVREWAMRVIDSMDTNDGIITNIDKNEVKFRMSCMFRAKTAETTNGLSSKFVFNSKNGEALGTLVYRIASNTIATTHNDWLLNAGTISSAGIEENVGDMVRSNYLIIRDRNYPNTDGYICAYELNNPVTYKYSHILYHDVEGNGLENVFIKYQNMYL